jgi:nucleoside-diphosphate-sugar epimerase
MARVLVTGASGFIGSQLTRRLVADGDEVTCLVRRTSSVEPLRKLGVRLATGDVRDADSVHAAINAPERKPDVVYHLAGLVTAFTSDELMAVNAEGVRNVVAACAKRETPPAVVYVSSLAAAGPSHGQQARTEDDPAEPVSHYGRAKRAGEIIAHEFAGKVPITIVRPPIVFGEGDPAMRDVFRSIFRFGIHLALGVAHQRYSLIHVADLVDGLVRSGQRGTRIVPKTNGGAPSGRGYYFVAADEQPTFAELGVLIGISLGRARVWVASTPGHAMLWSAAALAELVARVRRQPYIFNFDKVREARAGSWICSPQAIRGELGFAPGASLVDRLRQTSDWYRSENWL